ADPRARSSSLSAVVASWAARDLAAARDFTLSLPRGELRDETLSIVLSQSAAFGGADRAVLDAFSSESLRQQRLVGLMPGIARRDREQAEALLDAYVRDPALRRQAAEYIEAVGSSSQ